MVIQNAKFYSNAFRNELNAFSCPIDSIILGDLFVYIEMKKKVNT